LLEFALKVFDLQNDVDEEARRRAEATRRELAATAEKKKAPPKPPKNPLGAAIRRLREEGKNADDNKA
ncbi:MAG: hypothetical protein IKK39_06020, partial [Thermoguttaceae bacterium]|nr:hypothetical protein [Thermoguttaceae bacterium]